MASTSGYQALMVVPVTAGEEIFFDVSVRDKPPFGATRLADEIDAAEFRSHYGSSTPWRAPFGDTVNVQPSFVASTSTDADGNSAAATVVFLVRRGTEILARKDFTVGGLSNYTAALPLSRPIVHRTIPARRTGVF